MAERRVVRSDYSNGYNNYVAGESSRGGDVRSVNSNNIASIEAPHNPDEEEAYLRQAIENSLKESPNRPSTTGSGLPAAAAANNLLLDFMDPPAATAPVSA